ncbi:MAG: lysozyme [Okeania sp. SIO3B5]|uniref:lysozyme n=1 Tax=Okeania sp. SIO3B5 TaxID=2607811 RepID=UPI001400FACC|nr:lysozyme [Okeania sp. SIO3B5]NEO55458.1 lysozyme [Okeania sp. SIO3B5]
MQVLRKISQNCLNIIKKWEGLYLDAYLNSVEIWSIGYGITEYSDGKKVKQGDEISIQQARKFLQYKVDKVTDEVNQLIRVSLTQNQFDALVSFCYNVGITTFKYSTLLEKLNQGDYQSAANEFPKWNKVMVNGVKTILPSLVERRDNEKNLFLSNNFTSNNELSYLAGLGLFDPMAVSLKPLH